MHCKGLTYEEFTKGRRYKTDRRMIRRRRPQGLAIL